MPKRPIGVDELIDRHAYGLGYDSAAYESGRWYGPNRSADQTGSVTLAADKIYFGPFTCFHDHTFTDIGIDVTSAATASSLARLGVYGSDSRGRPGPLILDAGTVAVDSAVKKAVTGLTLKLLRGRRYWTAIVSDGAPTLRSASFRDVPNSAGGFDQGTIFGSYEDSFTFAALPDPAVPTIHNGNTSARIGTAVFLKAE